MNLVKFAIEHGALKEWFEKYDFSIQINYVCPEDPNWGKRNEPAWFWMTQLCALSHIHGHCVDLGSSFEKWEVQEYNYHNKLIKIWAAQRAVAYYKKEKAINRKTVKHFIRIESSAKPAIDLAFWILSKERKWADERGRLYS